LPIKEAGMADTTFTIGAAVECSDGPCGAVSRVVVDPVARELTHLVVEPEHRSGLGRLVPLDLVESGADDVRLGCTLAQFEKLAAAEETDFLPGGSGYEAYAAHEAYYWPYFGLEGGADPTLALASAVETRDMLPPGEIGVRRGETVHASDGEIGRVEGLVIDSVQRHVTHVLLQEGHLWGKKQVAIPIDAVEKIDRGITVNMTKHEIESLPAVEVTAHHR
jgi:sporulation protein YlmC with PRC-barrel domain